MPGRRIVDHVQLGGGVGGAELGPAGQRGQLERSRVDEPQGIARRPRKARLEPGHECADHRLKRTKRSLGIGVGQVERQMRARPK